MVRRRMLAIATLLIATMTVLGAPSAQARHHRRYRAHAKSRACRNDKQCKGGTCNGAGQCCSTFGGEVACGMTCCDTLLGEVCCGNACIDVAHDHDNCGACGNVCTGGTTCQNGSCACPFTYPTQCNGECVNTASDPDNCGSCGNACASRSCTDSRCDCPGGETACNGTCVDTTTDRNNCGTCGNACPADRDCVDGSCENLCPPCEVFQDGACVPRECGDCEACDPAIDACTPLCWPGQVCCGGECKNSPTPGAGECCEWQGVPFVCASGQQCAGAFGCCPANKEVCVSTNGTGTPQCCDGIFSCVQTESGAAACCVLGASEPGTCCGFGNCLPKECCRPS